MSGATIVARAKAAVTLNASKASAVQLDRRTHHAWIECG